MTTAGWNRHRHLVKTGFPEHPTRSIARPPERRQMASHHCRCLPTSDTVPTLPGLPRELPMYDAARCVIGRAACGNQRGAQIPASIPGPGDHRLTVVYAWTRSASGESGHCAPSTRRPVNSRPSPSPAYSLTTSRSSMTKYCRSQPKNMLRASAGEQIIASPRRFSEVLSTTPLPVSFSSSTIRS